MRLYDWVQSSINRELPRGAVWCGKDSDDSDVYIGRARHRNVILLVKIIPRRSYASFAYYGKEHSVAEYEVLVNLQEEPAKWVCSSKGQVPLNAVQCGFTTRGKIYVGRAHHQCLHVPGYVHPSLKCIYYPFDSKEHFSDEHEVLVHNVPH